MFSNFKRIVLALLPPITKARNSVFSKCYGFDLKCGGEQRARNTKFQINSFITLLFLILWALSVSQVHVVKRFLWEYGVYIVEYVQIGSEGWKMCRTDLSISRRNVRGLYHVRRHHGAVWCWCVWRRLLTTCMAQVYRVGCGRVQRRWIERHRINTIAIDVHVIYEIITVNRCCAGCAKEHSVGRSRHWKCIVRAYRSICSTKKREFQIEFEQRTKRICTH